MVIGDRWIAHRRRGANSTDPSWQRGLLQVAQACAQGDSLLAQRWQTHFQALPDRAAVLINAFPYLWLQADAQAHHRTSVGRWASQLGRSPATARACEDLFDLICQQMDAAGLGRASISMATVSAGGDPLGSALELVAQSQGQFAVVLGAARGRGWTSTELALAGLLAGLTLGRAGVGAGLRQRWLRLGADGEQDRYPDFWQGMNPDTLGAIATSLHYRWMGGEVSIGLESPLTLWR